jgi:hypothetical protein
MNQPEERTMVEVVARLRETSPEATIEIAELYLAVREIAINSSQLAAALREVAAEAASLAAHPDAATAERLKNIATYTATLRGAAEAGSAALSELRAGVEGWGFVLP